MQLTPQQTATFKTDILAKAGVSFSLADQGAVAAYYNASAGAGYFWRNNISILELNTAIVWSEFLLMTVAQQNAYFAMTQGGAIDATALNIRNGFGSVFAGLVSLTNLTTLAQKVPTRFQALFITANIIVPSLANATVTPTDITLAMAS